MSKTRRHPELMVGHIIDQHPIYWPKVGVLRRASTTTSNTWPRAQGTSFFRACSTGCAVLARECPAPAARSGALFPQRNLRITVQLRHLQQHLGNPQGNDLHQCAPRSSRSCPSPSGRDTTPPCAASPPARSPAATSPALPRSCWHQARSAGCGQADAAAEDAIFHC
jgi:hypothetical protein